MDGVTIGSRHDHRLWHRAAALLKPSRLTAQVGQRNEVGERALNDGLFASVCCALLHEAFAPALSNHEATNAAQLGAAPDRGPFVWPGASRASCAADFVRGALGMRGLADR